jgi:peptidoglycan/LPS O-acetylase OafA/YrhL
LKYRQEIDGLRSLAIIPVLLFHLGTPLLTGGFLGVDVFFVISGYLITNIILEELTLKKFSIINFYERRARRILPALVVMMTITGMCLMFLSLSPSTISEYGTSSLSVIFFSSNIYFWLTSGYFGTASELSPLLHTWSLAVEEQFYLFFPILALLIFPRNKKTFTFILMILVILSLFVSEWGWRNSPEGNFYLIPSRIWELLIGSLSAMLLNSEKLKGLSLRNQSLLALLGFVTIIASYFLFTPETVHPSLLTVFPVVGTALIIIFSTNTCLIGRFLSFRPLVFIGLMSYSLYLWHQPIFALVKLKYSLHLTLEMQLILLSTTFIMAYLSWRFVEKPFRNRNEFDMARIFKLSFSSIVAVFILGVCLQQNVFFQKLIYPKDMARYEVLKEAGDSHYDQKNYDQGCKFITEEIDSAFEERFMACTKMYPQAIVVIGGSHGIDLYNAFSRNTKKPFVVGIARGFCRAHNMIGATIVPHKCQYEDFKGFAKKYGHNINYVMYTQTPDRLFTKHITLANKSNLSLHHVVQVVNYLKYLKEDLKLNVTMIGMLPPITKSPINFDYKRSLDLQINDYVSQNSIEMAQYTDSVFSAYLNEVGITYVSKIDSFRLNLPKDIIYEGKITYSDNRHISYAGEMIFGKRLVDYLSIHGLLN